MQNSFHILRYTLVETREDRRRESNDEEKAEKNERMTRSLRLQCEENGDKTQ